MFTGLIQAVGRIAEIESGKQDIRLRIDTGKLPLEEVSLGDSIATSGVCLTVTDLPGDGFWADVSPGTLSLTTLGGKESVIPSIWRRPYANYAARGASCQWARMVWAMLSRSLRMIGSGASGLRRRQIWPVTLR